MKQLTLFFAAILLTITGIFAQTPSQFKYQAVLRNADGTIIANESVTIGISILQGSESGLSVFDETHYVTTTEQGIINLNIGSVSDISSVNWSVDSYFVEITVNNTLMGVSQLLSVPYALYAKNAGNTIWTLNNNNIYYDGGNVGIGTSTPENLLTITKDIPDGNRTFLKIENTSFSSISSAALEVKSGSQENYTTLRMHGDNYDYSWWGKHGQLKTVGDGLIIESTKADKTGGDIVFVNGSTGGDQNIKTINMLISGDGNVGIGVSEPARKLHISDAFRMEPLSAAPTNPAKGDIYFGTDGSLHIYDGSNWNVVNMTIE